MILKVFVIGFKCVLIDYGFPKVIAIGINRVVVKLLYANWAPEKYVDYVIIKIDAVIFRKLILP